MRTLDLSGLARTAHALTRALQRSAGGSRTILATRGPLHNGRTSHRARVTCPHRLYHSLS